MARTEIPIVVLSSTGVPVQNASVQINARSGGAATVFQFQVGVQTLANPVLTDVAGRVTGWLDRGAYDAVITATGLTPYTEQFDSVPGYDGAIDTAWLADGSVTAAKLASGAAGGSALSQGSVTRDKMAGGLFSLELGMQYVEGVSGGPQGGYTGGAIDVRNVLVVSTVSAWTIQIASGWGFVQGDDGTPQGLYPFNVSTSTSYTLPTTAPVSNSRIDAIGVQWNDPIFTGRTPTNSAVIVQQTGTATSGANLTNLTGAPGQSGGPALSPSFLVLAYVLINAGDSSVSGANIQDRRKVAGPALWGEDGHRYRLGIDAGGTLGIESVF